MPKAQETILEIDLKALKHNFEYLKSKLNNGTNFLAVVKAFAYGNDAEEIARYLQDLDIDYFAVAYANEGAALRKAGVTKPILVLHTLATNFDVILDNCLEPNLYNAKILDEFIAFAEAENQKEYPVHIKFNTGLNRLGFWETDVAYVVSKLIASKAIKVKSLFSHLAASEDLSERDFTLAQIERFKIISRNFSKALGYEPLLHMSNTSGVLNYPEAHFDMVRCGIGLYGYGNAQKESANLKPIASLKTIISQIHKIEKGESVGYNRAFKSEALFTKTATLPIGHADGISRIYGNGKGFVTINGKQAPIIGNVCMDMIMVNVTDIDCEEGDEVIVFNGNTTSAETLAEGAGTISYELITGISQRVKRVVLK
ncbi:alanine racemase [Hyunsoonleella jejuensis]|uniref:Alanine racemase n=1 Tax=Hyunsoonleella jejuensis TaxID=419940 RepID=A0A1H9BB85_9FLAO|nr:alanine racemase [Hyunsoonleella jejuensis]SEP86256.1 alanine racemase [Hyunsoonleella jejuensis]